MIRHAEKCVRMLPPKVGIARKEYACDGCGEIPIRPGNLVMTSVAVLRDGSFHRSHYCIRCMLAIEQKKKFHGGTVAVEQGSLKLSCLSNAFRKTWRGFIQRIRREPADNGSIKGMAADLFNELGLDFNVVGVEKSNFQAVTKKMREIKKERRLRRQQKQEAEAMEIQEYRKAARNADMALAAMDLLMDELGKAQLQVRHTAAVGGDLVVACHKLVEVRNKIAAVLQDARKQLGELQA